VKICLLSYRGNPHCGGQGVYVRNLSKALVDLGHSVDIVSGPPYPHLENGLKLIRLPSLDLYNPDDLFRTPTLGELSNPVNLIEWLGVSTMGFPEPYTFGLRAFRYLKPRCSRYDIIHDNQSLSYGIQRISRYAPTVATIHHPITIDRDIAIRSASPLWKKLKQVRWYSFVGMQKKVARKLPHIITVSKSSGRDISRQFKIPYDRFRIVPNGIDTRLFYPLPEIKRLKNQIMVTNSADTPLKGLDYLLPAVKEISRNHDVRLLVIGALKKGGAVEKRVRQLGIGHLLTFTGRIDGRELVRHYARSTVAVIPSIYEGFGLPAGEAMACRIPVIGTTGGALPEVIGSTGILVPPADSPSLAKALRDVIENPALADRLARAGYQRVQDEFTWPKAAAKTVAAYREAIDAYGRL